MNTQFSCLLCTLVAFSWCRYKGRNSISCVAGENSRSYVYINDSLNGNRDDERYNDDRDITHSDVTKTNTQLDYNNDDTNIHHNEIMTIKKV